MTERDDALRQIEQAAGLVPELSERLGRHGLGEIEVRHGELRVRVAGGDARPIQASPAAEPVRRPESASVPAEAPPTTTAVASPAVGFFVYADGLGPGLGVEKGDALGYVEMLGVRHDVRAPRSGSVRNLVAETGEAVEYGQTVLELDTAEAAG